MSSGKPNRMNICLLNAIPRMVIRTDEPKKKIKRVTAHNNAVDHTVEILKDVSQHKRNRKMQNQFSLFAYGKIFHSKSEYRYTTQELILQNKICVGRQIKRLTLTFALQ